MARLAAYVPALRASTAELLERLDPEAETYLDLRECRWTYGARVVVRLHAAGLAVTPAEQSFVWRGTRDLVDFQVDVPEEGAPARTVLRFEVVLAGFVVATIALPLAVGASVPEGGRALETATPTRRWFASHARRDRRRVLDRVAALRSAMRDVEIFIDRSLLPGERWRRRIEEEIAACETFLLFWSPRARRSRWVAWEWKLALEKKGIDRFQLHPLAYAPPPPELAELQVDDETNDLRDAEGWLLSAWRRVAAIVP
ncbi:MAG TPA: TIR domain-containing protein [Longimicrobium sp.]|nr:TIR domain-containing protein [Longimicrobium sp.]